YQTKWCLVLR
ncbi:hypothetical protein D030_4181B, partial [Vibrio parahaemolyticus AQ3810]